MATIGILRSTSWCCSLALTLQLLLFVAATNASVVSSRVWIVELHPQVSASQAPPWNNSRSRADRRDQVASYLQAHVIHEQERIENIIYASVAALDAASAASVRSVQVEKLWIQNTLLVRLLPMGQPNDHILQVVTFLSHELRWLPGVISVERDAAVGLTMIHPELNTTTENLDQEQFTGTTPQKNIRLVHAPELWEQAGLLGQGVTVASIDSGVRYTHEALAKTFRGYSPTKPNVSFDYSFWFPTGTDMSKETPDTADQVGHGTHTVGTAVGALGIGVAPNATWIAARAFDIQGAVPKSDFLLATQWALCPTKLDGSAKNCFLGADVITGSFGVDRSDVETYKQWTWITHILQVWRAAGSYAVFASGNTNGFKCGSVYYPASREETVAVGALLGGSTLWGASGKGPSTDGGASSSIIKPDFVAPGGAIRSALSTTNSAYTRMTGTSMATPHVTGMLALLLSGAKKSQSDLVAALKATASRSMSKPFLVPSTCGGTRYDQYPNNIYGSGLPDVCQAAVKALGVSCKSSSARSVRSAIDQQISWSDVVRIE